MAQVSKSHRVVACTTCRHTGEICQPGLTLIAQLNAAIAAAGPTLEQSFEVSGTTCMAGCNRPCTVAFSASAKASYLFGDIGTEADIDSLTEFARFYADRADGMSRMAERPARLRHKLMARIPASLVVTEAAESLLQ